MRERNKTDRQCVRWIKILRLAVNLFARLASKRRAIGIVGKIADYHRREYIATIR
jgi:hypothetical protein